MNAIQNPLSGLKNFSQSLTKHLKGCATGFTELHAELDADTTLLYFAIHRKQK
jgi:hypothetical protein